MKRSLKKSPVLGGGYRRISLQKFTKVGVAGGERGGVFS